MRSETSEATASDRSMASGLSKLSHDRMDGWSCQEWSSKLSTGSY